MPESPNPKIKPHPWQIRSGDPPSTTSAHDHQAAPPYADLAVTSNFTFLTGASHPEELVQAASSLGHRAAAITDLHTLAGIVRAHVAAREVALPLVIGTRIGIATHADTPFSIFLYAADRASYARLCRLLTLGKRRAPKGECLLTLHDVLEHQRGLLAVVRPPAALDQAAIETIEGLARVFDDDRLSIGVSRDFGPDDRELTERLDRLSTHIGVPLVAMNDVLYHHPRRRALQDVLTCIRHGCTIDEAGFRLRANAERFMKSPEEMLRLFSFLPSGRHAVARSWEIARRASAFSLNELRYEYPDEVVPPGKTPMEHLRSLVHAGVAEKYGSGPTAPGAPARVLAQIEHELKLIDELNYAPYFLTVHDLVVYARSRAILCQGRGAAANSAVCYCLGVTNVDPARIDLLFERFVSKERNEPPDIDIDFEHERREEVIQYLYNKYGRERCALTAVVITYRGRSAIRDVGKAMGLSLDCVDRLAKSLDWWERGVVNDQRLRDLGLNPAEPRLRTAIHLAGELLGSPRHLSQHVGGFVMTRSPLCEMVPIENAAMEDRTVIEWDKDDIDAAGMLKVDVLGLGMLTAARKAMAMINGQSSRCQGVEASPSLRLDTIPSDDPAVYDMICRADTVGVFQIESRAQMSMLPRLRPRCFYDLVIEVAIVRPGPIQGDMVHPYLRRRNGEEPVDYPSEAVRAVLGKTLGVPLFQEQAMKLAIVAAGFTPGEADQLRRAMAAWKRKGDRLLRFEGRFVGGMLANGYAEPFARRCFEQLKGFSEYGFPESHAASFAHIVYVTAWLKHYYPAHFAAALINSQPMGFYAPAQIVRDAREHGVQVLEVDVNRSGWDCSVEPAPSPALRLGLRLVKGLSEQDGRAIEHAVAEHGPFASIDDLRSASCAVERRAMEEAAGVGWGMGGVGVGALRRLAAADAFRSMGLDRQTALWHIRALRDEHLPLFDPGSGRSEVNRTDLPEPALCRTDERTIALHDKPEPVHVMLPEIPGPRQIIDDYANIGLSLKGHPVAAMRDTLRAAGSIENSDLRSPSLCPQGKRVCVAGLVLVRQRPGTASGVVFMTLEDETGIANLILRPGIYERFRKAARHGVMVMARGIVERQNEVVHVMVRSLRDLTDGELVSRSRDFH